jgi:hypothetical protein
MEIFNNEILFFYAEGVDVYNQESLTNINLYDTNPIIISTFRVPMERIAQ